MARRASRASSRPRHAPARERYPATSRHARFALVLAGGGARGLCHVGVLRALEHYGYRPSALVGVSMGAVVAVTYALNRDWYAALVNIDTAGLPNSSATTGRGVLARLRALLAGERMLRDMVFGWGIGARSLATERALLDSLTLGMSLEEGAVPTTAVATDLRSGRRIAIERGNAAEAAYASAALAGVFPPLEEDGLLLADGAYADLVPVDLARKPGIEKVIAVDPHQESSPRPPRNGVEAMLKAMEICAREHALLRFGLADLVLRPKFPVQIDTLEFAQKRVAIAAGIAAVRESIGRLRLQLEPA